MTLYMFVWFVINYIECTCKHIHNDTRQLKLKIDIIHHSHTDMFDLKIDLALILTLYVFQILRGELEVRADLDAIHRSAFT